MTGCSEALNYYFLRLRGKLKTVVVFCSNLLIVRNVIVEKIGRPVAPALVADSLTSTSLSLEWDGTKYSNLSHLNQWRHEEFARMGLSNSSYLVQWRYEELAGAWQYCRNQTWGHSSIVTVNNLQPYTKYRVST